MIKVGCCGFAGGKNKYYSKFDIVELQQTFYQLPKLNTADSWRKAAPSQFEFTLKAWQLITHPPSSPTYRRLRTVISQNKLNYYGFFKPTDEVFSAWQEVDQICQILLAKIIVFQCPASFTPTTEHKENLCKFFQTITRRDYVFVWEPRGDWKDAQIKELCKELNLIHCVDPFAKKPLTTGLTYFRLHGRPPGKKMYYYQYTSQDLAQLAKIVNEYEQVYCLFNNLSMYIDALNFKSLL